VKKEEVKKEEVKKEEGKQEEAKDDSRMGKWRLDKLADYFDSLMPPKSSAFNHHYSKMWDPANYAH